MQYNLPKKQKAVTKSLSLLSLIWILLLSSCANEAGNTVPDTTEPGIAASESVTQEHAAQAVPIEKQDFEGREFTVYAPEWESIRIMCLQQN